MRLVGQSHEAVKELKFKVISRRLQRYLILRLIFASFLELSLFGREILNDGKAAQAKNPVNHQISEPAAPEPKPALLNHFDISRNYFST